MEIHWPSNEIVLIFDIYTQENYHKFHIVYFLTYYLYHYVISPNITI